MKTVEIEGKYIVKESTCWKPAGDSFKYPALTEKNKGQYTKDMAKLAPFIGKTCTITLTFRGVK